MLMILVAIVGLLFPNGIYAFWLFAKFDSIGEAAHDRLAVSIFVELLAATLLVAYQFRVNRLGHVRVRWFLILSFVGGLGFGIPIYYWLNKRLEKKRLLHFREQVRFPSRFSRSAAKKSKKLKLVPRHA
jgi:hypothetical protein